jgi:hypothetical protein
MLRTNQVCNLKHGNSLLKIRLVIYEIEIHHKNSLKKTDRACNLQHHNKFYNIRLAIYNMEINLKISGL